jgi:hypothetical protein
LTVIAQLSKAMSVIHISFYRWMTKGGKRGFFGVVAHFVDQYSEIREMAIDYICQQASWLDPAGLIGLRLDSSIKPSSPL